MHEVECIDTYHISLAAVYQLEIASTINMNKRCVRVCVCVCVCVYALCVLTYSSSAVSMSPLL